MFRKQDILTILSNKEHPYENFFPDYTVYDFIPPGLLSEQETYLFDRKPENRISRQYISAEHIEMLKAQSHL